MSVNMLVLNFKLIHQLMLHICLQNQLLCREYGTLRKARKLLSLFLFLITCFSAYVDVKSNFFQNSIKKNDLIKLYSYYNKIKSRISINFYYTFKIHLNISNIIVISYIMKKGKLTKVKKKITQITIIKLGILINTIMTTIYLNIK